MPSCHVERSETSLIYYFHALPKKQLEMLSEAEGQRMTTLLNASILQLFNDHSFVRPESTAESVSSSADSRPPPAGMPRAIRVRLTGLAFKKSTMKVVVDSPSTSAGS